MTQPAARGPLAATDRRLARARSQTPVPKGLHDIVVDVETQRVEAEEEGYGAQVAQEGRSVLKQAADEAGS